MSKTELDFECFLKKHNIRYETQKKIFNVPFTQKSYHLVDFYLIDLDLYIEIKGFMTLFQVNVLKYLMKYRKETFYILQVTEEDWIEQYQKDIHYSIKNKIELNKQKQYKEILNLAKHKVDKTKLHNVSLQRLKDYIDLRKQDLDKWKQK